MEEKINIAEILKDKAEGTKLYSPICGECKLSYVESAKSEPQISTESDAFGVFYFWDDGKAYNEGECILFPSSEMRDWSKFAWKKGDVLVNSRGLKILFDRWANGNYTSFYAKTINLVEDGFLDTNLHTLASEKEAKSFIKCIEERFGGKLNLQTLEIQKQPEFKDGDIVFMKGIKGGYYANCIFILRSEYKDGDERAFYYAFYNTDDKFTIAEYGNTRVHYSLRPATDSEKQQLFDALEKKGKAWDSEKKQIVDLPKKCELNPFDQVLVRDNSKQKWIPDMYRFYDKDEEFPYNCFSSTYKRCIPYNEETAHLLGTTDEWKGGEQ